MIKVYTCTKCGHVRQDYRQQVLGSDKRFHDEVCEDCAWRKVPDDDTVRAQRNAERQGNADREWAQERDRRSGAYFE